MNQMKQSLRIYIFCMIGAGAAAMLWALAAMPVTLSHHQAVLATLIVGLSGLTYLAPVKLAPHRRVIMDTPLHMIAILVLSPGEAALFCAAGVALGNRFYVRRPWFNALFNTAQVALSVLAAGAVYRALAPVSLADPARQVGSALAVVPAGVLLYLVSHLAVDGAAAIQQRRSPFAHWLAVHGPSLVPHAALVVIGAAITPAIDRAPWLIVVAIAPVAAVRAIMRTSMQFDSEMIHVAEELADAAERRLGSPAGGSRRFANLALRVSRAAGLPDDDCRRVELAARLHHVDAALRPEAPPSEEMAPMTGRRTWTVDHAEESAAYIRNSLKLAAVAEVLRFHHESFDGQGLPQGLSGKDIPLESRILAVCEAWVSLTADCEYRPALTAEQTLIVLRAGAGTQWDPDVVETLCGVVATPQSQRSTAPTPAFAGLAGAMRAVA